MSRTCSTSILGWEDVHCQTSRFDIDKQSCPRALQPHVNTHSLDPSSAWSCTKQASTGACSLRNNLSVASASLGLSMWLKPDTLQTKSLVKVCWAGKTFTAKLQDSRSTSNHVRGLCNPTWTHTPWTPPPLGATPNRLLPELAPHRTIEAIKI